MASRTTKSDLETIVEKRIQPMVDGDIMLRASGGGGGRQPTYALSERLDRGGRTDIIRAQGAGRMERALRGLEKGLQMR